MLQVSSLPFGLLYDFPSASEATLKNMDGKATWSNENKWYNHNETKHNETLRKVYGIYCNSRLNNKTSNNNQISIDHRLSRLAMLLLVRLVYLLKVTRTSMYRHSIVVGEDDSV